MSRGHDRERAVQRRLEWQTCPKCGGQGHVNKPPYIAGDQPSWLDCNTGGYPCLVCRGAKVLLRP